MSNPGTTPTNCPKCQTALLNAPGIGPFCPNRACDVADGPFDGSPKPRFVMPSIGQDRLVAELNRRCHRMEVAIINIRSYAKKVGLKNLEADCDEALQHD